MERLNNKINNSKFTKLLTSVVKDIYAEHLRIFIDDEKKPDAEFNEYGNDRELLLKRIFIRFTNLSNHFEKLIHILKYIDEEFVTEFCENKELDEIDYYQYHFENFLVRLVSLLDLCAKIGNVLYKLEIPNQKCNWYKFVNHSEIVGKKCCTDLWSFANYLDTLKSDRHIIMHSGGFESEEISSIQSKIFNSDLIPIEDVLQDWFDTQKTEEISRLVDFMNNKIENALNHVFNFLDSMEPDLKLI